MNKQVSLVEAGNGWIVQVVDPAAAMAFGNPLTNLVARNVDEALYLVRQALTGVGERQVVPPAFTEAVFEEPVSEAQGLMVTPQDLTLGALFAGMQMIAGFGEAAAEDCDCEHCQVVDGEGGEDETI
jgi:hypothetical protein